MRLTLDAVQPIFLGSYRVPTKITITVITAGATVTIGHVRAELMRAEGTPLTPATTPAVLQDWQGDLWAFPSAAGVVIEKVDAV